MSALPVLEEPVRFHLSLNVPDLNKAIAFYEVLFGIPPAKRHDDYAKFDLTDPPVVFSLVPRDPGVGCTLSHLGLRVSSDETIQQFRERLQLAGVGCETQNGTVCGYAKQNKLWIPDPFGNFWEVYRIEEDVKPELVRTSRDGKAARVDVPECASHPKANEVVWEHFVTNPLPECIPHDDGTVHEVRLIGTFNANLQPEQCTRLLQEAFRVLQPGGKVLTHGLMADAAFAGPQPQLPGLAAMVSRVPVQTEPIAVLVAAGFTSVQFVKLTEKAWFTHADVGFREVKLMAWKPLATTATEQRIVLYKGPFPRVTTDGAHTFTRGQRTAVSAAVWEQLRVGLGAEQFLFFEPGQASGCSIGG